MRIALCLLALTGLVLGLLREDPLGEEAAYYSEEQEVWWFQQILDHYSYSTSHTWNQRYYVDRSYYNPSHGPVILYIGGEGPCRGININSWLGQMAKETQALMIALEHRYYGESLPLRENSFTLEGLQYLSSKQALKDMAFFIEQLKANHQHGISPNTKWITVGGSYAGALSAWFRSKYPHLTVGAISSSGVVNAIEDFRQFDEQIYISTQKSGLSCSKSVQDLVAYAEAQSLSDNKDHFQAQYGAEKLSTREFMFYWADVLVFQVQYSKRTKFCQSVKGKTFEEILQVVKPLMKAVDPREYGSFYLKNSSFALTTGLAGRAWYWQCCTEFSYFQTWSEEHPMRSKLLTLSFWRKWCQDSYGDTVTPVWPAVDRTNIEYGGTHLRATNLFMSNGVEDPWKWASILLSTKEIVARVIDCPDCGHCVDLRAPNAKTDSKSLTQVRAEQLAAVKSWLK